MSFIVGLTGGIGSGKSAVADLFSSFGVKIVDTDVIAHELTQPGGRAMQAIRSEFGAEVVESDGRLNRAAMRRLVFSHASVKTRLEAILHPMIRDESEKQCRSAHSPYVILVVPLLVETGFFCQRLDRILVVDCDEATQAARVMARNGLSSDEVRAIMHTQALRQDRLAAADDVILNNEGIEMLAQRTAELHQHYLVLACAEKIGGQVAESNYL